LRITSSTILGITLASGVAAATLCGSPGSAGANPVTNGSLAITTATPPGANVCSAATSGNSCVSTVAGWATSGPRSANGRVVNILFAGTGGSGWNDDVGLADNTVPNPPNGGNYIAGDGDPTFSERSFRRSAD